MPKTCTRLTEDERYQIYEGVTGKRLHREIATLINTHHSTVSNEVKPKGPMPFSVAKGSLNSPELNVPQTLAIPR
jgi:hypothetical protein